MAIKTIPLSRLEADLKRTLNESAESGETLVVEMPDQRLLAIQSLDPQEDDTLMDELLAVQSEVSIAGSEIQSQPAQTVFRGKLARISHGPVPRAKASEGRTIKRPRSCAVGGYGTGRNQSRFGNFGVFTRPTVNLTSKMDFALQNLDASRYGLLAGTVARLGRAKQSARPALIVTLPTDCVASRWVARPLELAKGVVSPRDEQRVTPNS